MKRRDLLRFPQQNATDIFPSADGITISQEDENRMGKDNAEFFHIAWAHVPHLISGLQLLWDEYNAEAASGTEPEENPTISNQP